MTARLKAVPCLRRVSHKLTVTVIVVVIMHSDIGRSSLECHLRLRVRESVRKQRPESISNTRRGHKIINRMVCLSFGFK